MAAARLACLAFALAILLAGCAGIDSSGNSDSEDSISTVSLESTKGREPEGNQTAGVGSDTTPPAMSLDFDGCTGFELGVHMPTGLNPAPVPPGWEDSDPTDLTTINWVFVKCERIGLGELERPALVLLEVTNNGDAPEACAIGAAGRVGGVLVQAWVDDPNVAATMSSQLRWIVHEATFKEEVGSMGDVWVIQSAGSEGRVEEIDVPDNGEAGFPDWTLWWTAGEGLGRWDADVNLERASSSETAVVTPMNSSYLSHINDSVPAAFDQTWNAQYNGPITWYESHSCS